MPIGGPIARGTARTSAVLALRITVQAGTLLIVARLLGPEGFGAFAGLASLAVVMGTLSTFGMQLVLLSEVSRDPAQRDPVLAQALPVTLSLGTILLAAFFVLGSTELGFAHLPWHALLAIGVAEILVQPLLTLSCWELTANGKPAQSQLLAMLPLSLRLALATGVLWSAPPEPLKLYAYAYLAASCVALAIVSSTRLSPWRKIVRWRWPGRSRWREAAGYAFLTSTTVAPAELDKTLATRLLPADEAGLYAAAQRLVGAATLPVSAMMLSALPRLYRESSHRSEDKRGLIPLLFGVSAAYGVALAATLWMAAPVALWLFGASYAGIETAISWLCFAVPAMSLRIAVGNALMATGAPWMRTGMEMAGLVTLGLVGIALSERLGAVGMALAFASAQWVMVVFGIIVLITGPHAASAFPPKAGRADDNKLRHHP